MNDRLKIELLNKDLKTGKGILRLAPTWVPRTFLTPGGRLKLDPETSMRLVQRGVASVRDGLLPLPMLIMASEGK